MLKSVGASGQLSLGKKYAGQYFSVEALEGGALLLKPMKVVPADEAWVHTPGMRARLAAADAWMDAHPPSQTDVERLLRRARPKAAVRAIEPAPRKRIKAAA